MTHGGHNTHGEHAQDVQRAQSEVSVTDASNQALRMLSGFFGGGHLHIGRSDFEGHELNAMIDLVENTKPSDLENAGQALFSARDAIREAAGELNGHIDNVDWHGDSGTAFRTWGLNLVKNTQALADYADGAGLQITAAGSGLSSVRSSMPPKDTRPHKKKVADIPAPARVEGNPDYDEAVKVEGHRQEAINQMNRLSSFYTVTSGALAQQKPPVFEPMPDVGVPKPTPGSIENPPSTGRTGPLGSSGQVDASVHRSTGHVSDDSNHQLRVHGEITDQHRPDVGMKIDTVATLPPTPPTDTVQTPTHTPPTSPTQQPPLPTAQGFVNQNPIKNGSVRAVGNTNTTPQARGSVRDTATGKGTTSAGRAANNMSRQAMNQMHASGRTSSTGRMPMGRGGVSGGTPRAASNAKSSSAGAVRKGGVVGGRPTSQTGGPTSRVPKGNVIGGQKETPDRNQRTPGKVGQRGVIGAPNKQSGKQGPTRRSPGAPEGIVGAPKERTKGPKGERAGFTSGGSGLVREDREQRRDDRDQHPDQHDRLPQEHPHHHDAGDPPTPEHRLPHAPPETD
ncbi:WXG100 family type VII secretion target [Streptomyces sp. TS71-3]|uniref:WXG100 family type VII secretion target n=1 Tax=Streptomyces sp. TS71-3 TaxID=2733862 RepID=UPI001B1A46EA|nr:hypothetical protein [Streptomyces sp. TS71-3]GHJ36386.1 hypothetical protein Sm713_19950 [Streptomyces sp. TS71-3]